MRHFFKSSNNFRRTSTEISSYPRCLVPFFAGRAAKKRWNIFISSYLMIPTFAFNSMNQHEAFVSPGYPQPIHPNLSCGAESMWTSRRPLFSWLHKKDGLVRQLGCICKQKITSAAYLEAVAVLKMWTQPERKWTATEGLIDCFFHW